MSSYDAFFKQAKKNAAPQSRGNKVPPKGPKGQTRNTDVESELRRAFGMPATPTKVKKFRGPKFSFGALAFTIILVAATGWLLLKPEMAQDYLSQLEVRLLGEASAAGGEHPAKSEPSGGAAKAKSAAAEADEEGATKSQDESAAAEDTSHFSKLNDRKKELDQREKELSELEEELQKQKLELEKRINELQAVRDQIAAMLKDRVEVDQAKVDKLVEFYSNMKPKQAAEIIATINEELAVEILGRMKKKNAAEIMNLLVPAKAQVLSEKYAGYKRR